MSTDRRRGERRQNQQEASAERRRGDRRQHDRRTEARAPLDLWVEEEKGNELYFRRTGNVSLGGLSFEQAIPHAIGTRVRLRFSLPDTDRPVEATAEIVNTPAEKNGLGMGLRFVDLSDAARAALQTFLDDG
jgi:uncharacterized protein (TIGR02266 family)